MSVVSAAGRLFKPVVVLPGRKVHYKTANGCNQTPQELLTPCYINMNEISGVDKTIFPNWMTQFVNESKD